MSSSRLLGDQEPASSEVQRKEVSGIGDLQVSATAHFLPPTETGRSQSPKFKPHHGASDRFKGSNAKNPSPAAAKSPAASRIAVNGLPVQSNSQPAIGGAAVTMRK